MAEELFWKTLGSLQKSHPDFGMGRKYCGFPRRFKRLIRVVDSTTIRLVSNCMDWAKHRRRKAAAKCHMSLNLKTFLPSFAIVKAGNTHDSTEAYELCAEIKAGEIVIFDKAYVDFKHLFQLNERDVFWVTRSKDNMQYETVGQYGASNGKILMDAEIKLVGQQTSKHYPETLRLVVAEVERNGKLQVMSFITNNCEWSALSICELYQAGWGVEVFFKQLKQTLQLGDFLGHNENAVRWQIWTALLTYVLLRFIAYITGWKHSFARLFTALRGVLWSRLDFRSVLAVLACGTARGKPRMCASPQQSHLPGFELSDISGNPAMAPIKT